ncbi:hypothetical protein L1987_55807 [Smallanthus sonchifolius]|uniref:Uncharacterized protein n=1 Tax=Smallanthus sonchifolius TaxID=185202 RepID=A0ACB9EC13_9ASTR|nr:hypothetical protein L1987_55807 [Smallanthus sonchifolius]
MFHRRAHHEPVLLSSLFVGGSHPSLAVTTHPHFFIKFQYHRFQVNRKRLVQSFACGFMVPSSSTNSFNDRIQQCRIR